MTDRKDSQPPQNHGANLPYALTLHCLLENRTRVFGRSHGSTYECPCGQFQWDTENPDPTYLGMFVDDQKTQIPPRLSETPEHRTSETQNHPPPENQPTPPDQPKETNQSLMLLGTIRTLTPSSSIRTVISAQIREIQLASYRQGVTDTQKAHCPLGNDPPSPDQPCPNQKKTNQTVHQCDQCPNR